MRAANNLRVIEGGRTTAVLARSKKTVKWKGREFRTYRFIDKDPVIDKLRTAIQRVYGRDDVAFRKGLAQISIRARISYSALCSWFYGDTKRPQFASLEATSRVIGMTFELVEWKGKR